MKRPMVLFSISLILGILTANKLGSYLPIAVLIFIFALISLLFHSKLKKEIPFIIVAIILFSIGAVEYIHREHLYQTKFLEFEGQQVTVKGLIVSEADIRESRVNYVFKTTSIKYQGSEKKINGKILLTTLNNSKYTYEYGRQLEIRGQLNIPKSARNPGGFDYREYLSSSGISATMFANNYSIEAGKLEPSNFLVNLGLKIKARIVRVIDKSLPKEQAGLLNGMLIGYTGGLSKDVQSAFSDAGLSHIMAVSGANVAFIVIPLVFIFRRFGLRQRLANPIIIAVLILFVFVTGFSPSVVRAVIMAIIILVGQIIRRETDVLTSISLAAILLLLYNPSLLFDIGFQLSFAATISIILFYKTIRNIIDFKFAPKVIVEVLAVTLAAQVGVIPITAYYFNKISLVSIITNLLVVPLTGVITILGFIMAILGQINIVFSQIVGYLNVCLLSLILYITKISSSLPFAVVTIITPPIFLIVAYYAAALLLLWYKPTRGIKLSPVLYVSAAALILIIFTVNTMLPRNLEVVFLDVGEGDSTFIRTSTGKTVLIDGGGASSSVSSGSNIGETTIIPFLLDYGVTKLDLVIATHPHDDHIQGLIPVLTEFKVDTLIIPKLDEEKGFGKLLSIAENKGIKVSACTIGDSAKLDEGTYLDVLYPFKNPYVDNSSLNNGSIVLKLHYKKTSILFTGDIEKEIENLLLEKGYDVSADVLKVSHHGSSTSSQLEFLKAINPKAAVISVGKNNFGHPSAAVLKSLDDENIMTFRTDICGGVVVKSNGSSISIKRTIK